MFGLILSVCLFCALYTIIRVVGQSSKSKKQKVFISLFFLGMFLLPLVIRYKGNFSGEFYRLIYTASYFCFIVVALFFCLIFLRDIIWIILNIREKVKNVQPRKFSWYKPVFLAKTNRILFILSVSICVYSLYAGLKTPDVKETILVSDKIKKPVTVVVLGDMHITRTLQVSKVKNIVSTVNKIAPDVIVLPGDTVDDKIAFIQPHLNELKNLKAPMGIYATAGNHEMFVGHDESKKALLDSGINYLFNEGLLLKDNVYLAGIPDTKTVRRISETVDIVKAFSAADKQNFKILLSHRPKVADALKYQAIDLVISAHTHGGQIFPFHIISKLTNGYLAGLYQVNGAMLYVSRGSGQWGPQMRFLAPSEISVIKILPWTDESAKKGPQSKKSKTDKPAPVVDKTASIVYPADKDVKKSFVETVLKEELKPEDKTMLQLQKAQQIADAEAKATAQKQERDFNEAKASLNDVFEEVISTKIQDDLAAERKKNKELQIELNQLRVDFEKSKMDADKALIKQRAALKVVEDERDALKQAIEEQRVFFASELKASEEMIQNQRRLLAHEQELSKKSLALQKELVKELEMMKEELRKYQRARELTAVHKKPLLVPVSAQRQNPQQVVSPMRPVQTVQNDRAKERRREERFANMEVIYQADGSVTRQMTKTVVIEYDTYYSVVKSVASYTTTPEEEARMHPVKIENALRRALGLPLVKSGVIYSPYLVKRN